MDYRSQVNPTYLTAKSTLFILAGAENEDAKRIIGVLGTQDELRHNSTKGNDGKPALSDADRKALMAGTATAIEARYEALSRYMRTKGYASLLDIACGYTPRSIYCAQAGIDYVGVDVPVVVEELQGMLERLGIEKEHPMYIGGDATNAASLKAAADMLKGEVLISCEGLTQYLSANEFEQFLGGVREILLEHGGAWLTSDMGVDYEAFATACMSGADAANTYHTARRQAMKASDIYGDGAARWDTKRKRDFIESHGLKIEEIPFYHDDENLVSLCMLPEEWQESVMRVLRASRTWVMTVDEDYQGSQVIEGAKHFENLNVTYTRQGGALLCCVDGRIDTISAPMLLEIIETNSEGITEMKVDAKNLQYISSAGLRVLVLAVKRLGEGSVEVFNTSEEVRGIFETTGFDQFVHVE